MVLDNEYSKVVIIDGQAVVQSIKNKSSMEKICDFGEEYVKWIARMMIGNSEARVIFARYVREFFPI